MIKRETEIKLSYAKADVKNMKNFFRKPVFIVMIKDQKIKMNS